MKILVYILATLIFWSCDNYDVPNCNELTIKQRHFEPLGIKRPGDSSMFYSYVHYLMLNDYDDKCFDQYDFVYAADKYLDTVKTNNPVEVIAFSKPFDFRPAGDLTDGDKFVQNGIVEIAYDIDSVFKKLPEIRSVSFLHDGKRYKVNELPVSLRQRRINYYHEMQLKSK